MGGGALPKPLLRVPEAGSTLIERVVRALFGIDAHPLIVGRRGWELPTELAALPEVGDDGRGPLGGLIAALEAAETPHLLVTACDMPFIDANVATLLVQEALRTGTGICPVVEGPDGESRVQPLLAVYRRDVVEDLRRIEREGVRSLREVVAGLDLPMMPLRRDAATDRSFMNVNTPGDLAEARRLASTDLTSPHTSRGSSP